MIENLIANPIIFADAQTYGNQYTSLAAFLMSVCREVVYGYGACDHPFHMPIPKPITNKTIENVTPIVPKLS